MDDFLRRIGSEFDPAFIKLHVGTDDLDELVEFTHDRGDLSPLVDAGLKPLLRNKLYRAIVEEQVARASRSTAIDTEINSDTEIHSDVASLSETSVASALQEVSNLGVCSNVGSANDYQLKPRSSPVAEPECGFQGNCCVCGQSGHNNRACPNSVLVVDDADFPPLGVKGPFRLRPVIDSLPPPPTPAGPGRRPRPLATVAGRGQRLFGDGFKQTNGAADQGPCPCCAGLAGYW
jgi:hypothetical protein